MNGTLSLSVTAAMNAFVASVGLGLRVTLTGPLEPRYSLAPSSQSSIFLNAVSTSSYAQPLQPSAAQSSKFLRLPRTNSMPFTELDPPRTRPRVIGITRSQELVCGVDL